MWALIGHPARVPPTAPAPTLPCLGLARGHHGGPRGAQTPGGSSSDVLLYQVNCNTWLLPDLIGRSTTLPGGPRTARALWPGLRPHLLAVMDPFRLTGKAPVLSTLSQHPQETPSFLFFC